MNGRGEENREKLSWQHYFLWNLKSFLKSNPIWQGPYHGKRLQMWGCIAWAVALQPKIKLICFHQCGCFITYASECYPPTRWRVLPIVMDLMPTLFFLSSYMEVPKKRAWWLWWSTVWNFLIGLNAPGDWTNCGINRIFNVLDFFTCETPSRCKEEGWDCLSAPLVHCGLKVSEKLSEGRPFMSLGAVEWVLHLKSICHSVLFGSKSVFTRDYSDCTNGVPIFYLTTK